VRLEYASMAGASIYCHLPRAERAKAASWPSAHCVDQRNRVHLMMLSFSTAMLCKPNSASAVSSGTRCSLSLLVIELVWTSQWKAHNATVPMPNHACPMSPHYGAYYKTWLYSHVSS
jgi:hypothetical protein